MLLATQVRAAGEIGHAIRTAGAPVLLRARKLSPLRARDAVFDGDTVRTDPRSLAELMLAQATRISLGPSSELKIDSFTANLGGQISLGGAMVSATTVRVEQDANVFFLDVSPLPPATYFLRLENQGTGRAQVAKLSVVR